MPMILHLRWNDVTAEQHAAVDRLVQDARSDPRCWSFTSTGQGRAVRATAVWDGEASLTAFSRGALAQLSTSSGLSGPQSAVFSVPDLYAAGYRPRVAVPAPRTEPEGAPVVAAG